MVAPLICFVVSPTRPPREAELIAGHNSLGNDALSRGAAMPICAAHVPLVRRHSVAGFCAPWRRRTDSSGPALDSIIEPAARRSLHPGEPGTSQCICCPVAKNGLARSVESTAVARAWMSWSSGKDSALALASAQRSGTEVVRLLVTFNSEADRVAMHAVRRQLIVAQADRLGIPVFSVDLPSPCTNSEYEARMAVALGVVHDDGVDEIVFGDLFLEDVRAYRELAMAGTGVVPVFPLWGRPTAELAREMIDVGIRAVVTCVDPRQLDASFAGRWFDRDFLRDLPPHVDPCGERGEFHTFVSDAPGFSAPIDVTVGSVVERDGFVFADVLRADVELASTSIG